MAFRKRCAVIGKIWWQRAALGAMPSWTTVGAQHHERFEDLSRQIVGRRGGRLYLDAFLLASSRGISPFWIRSSVSRPSIVWITAPFGIHGQLGICVRLGEMDW